MIETKRRKMKFRLYLVVFATLLMIVPFSTVLADTGTYLTTYGRITKLQNGNYHATTYEEAKSNYTACATTAVTGSEYGLSDCAYMTITETYYIWIQTGYNHVHLCRAIAGVTGHEEGDTWTALVSYSGITCP
jgi:hypothetical protein